MNARLLGMTINEYLSTPAIITQRLLHLLAKKHELEHPDG